jgi:hypothetical protein
MRARRTRRNGSASGSAIGAGRRCKPCNSGSRLSLPENPPDCGALTYASQVEAFGLSAMTDASDENLTLPDEAILAR